MDNKKGQEKLDKIEDENLSDEIVNNLEDAIEESTNSALIRQNKKHKRKVVIISLIIVVLIAILGIIFYILNNPRLIFTSAVNNMFNTLEENVRNVRDSNISSAGTIDEKYNNSISTFNNLSVSEENVTPIIKGVKTAFLEAISSEKIVGNDMTIKVNGRDVETNRVSLVINENNIDDVNDKFITNLKNNEDFLNAYSKISDYTKDEIEEKLNDLSPDNYISPLTISIYTTGITREFVKLEISREVNNTTSVINITKLSDNNYDYKVVKPNESLSGTITFNNNDIIISYSDYDNETVVNQGTLTVQRQY